jgi:uroporphyrin-III C-methyltransferase
MTRTPHLPPVDAGWPELLPGWVWLVGAGPGDPGLMTLHALNALGQADVIVYDALVDERILGWARADAQVEYAGKRGGKPSPKQRDISLRLIELALGRGGEEGQALVQAGVPIRIVPGITAGVAGLAYAGIPATHRDVNQAVTFFTGHDHTGEAPGALDWAALAKSSPVLVGYMAIKTLPSIATSLIAAGRSAGEPVAIIMDATLPTMRVLETTLGRAVEDLAASGMGPPAILCIGRVALMRQTLDWIGQMAGDAPRDLDPLGDGSARDAG